MENPQDMPTTADYAMSAAQDSKREIEELKRRVAELEKQVFQITNKVYMCE